MTRALQDWNWNVQRGGKQKKDERRRGVLSLFLWKRNELDPSYTSSGNHLARMRNGGRWDER